MFRINYGDFFDDPDYLDPNPGLKFFLNSNLELGPGFIDKKMAK